MTLLDLSWGQLQSPLSDPWFLINLCWWGFSAITSGMPEPEEDSPFLYVWIFRTFHILAANGTAYFSHRRQWGTISGPQPPQLTGGTVEVKEDTTWVRPPETPPKT